MQQDHQQLHATVSHDRQGAEGGPESQSHESAQKMPRTLSVQGLKYRRLPNFIFFFFSFFACRTTAVGATDFGGTCAVVGKGVLLRDAAEGRDLSRWTGVPTFYLPACVRVLYITHGL